MRKILSFILLIFCVSITVYIVFDYQHNKSEQLKKKEQQDLVNNITEHYSQYVKTNKTASLFLYDEKTKDYQKIGQISNDIELELKQIDITNQSIYFPLKNLNYYIAYEDVTPTDALSHINNRYKSFIPFNENITTKETTKFYDDNENLVYEIYSSFDLPIIIKEKEKYGIEFNNQLFFVAKDDVNNVHNNSNTTEPTRENIRTFTYHTVYNPKTQVCNSIQICHTIDQFTSHMKYLSENNYLTLTMEELEAFLDGKIRIPLKAVTITLDDGIHLENSVSIVEEYGVYATFFIITSKEDVTGYMNSKHARFESHTDNMHNNYKCPGGNQGGQMLCENHNNMVNDLKLSQQKLNGSYYFAYPFFDFNDRAIAALKEAGFKMAFIGQYGKEGYSESSTDRFMLRRKTIFGDLTLNEFINYLK